MIFGVSPNGKALDFGSNIAGSNPATLVWQKCHVRLTYANPSPTSGMLLRATTRLGGFSGLVAVVPVAYLYAWCRHIILDMQKRIATARVCQEGITALTEISSVG